jgi:alpha-1,3-fucosyltransferase
MEKNDETYPLFVYFFKEPPGKDQDVVYKENKKFSDLFNITYTYRRDSVIPFTYGKVLPKYSTENMNKAIQDNSIVEWKPVPKKLPNSIERRDLTYKTKGILWMVSHCTTDSRREDYVKKLQSHLSTLSIDIMGKCGENSLPESNSDGQKLGNIKNRI